LQTKSPDQATALLELLRSNREGGVGAVLQHFAQYRQEFPHLTTAASNASSSSSRQGAAQQTTVLTEPLDLPGLLDARGLAQPNSVASSSTRAQHATARDLAGPLEWFFNCVGALFYIMKPEEVDESIQSIQHVQVPLGDIVLANEDPKMTTIAAGLAGMAAIGVIHATLADPTTGPPAELADYFYEVAKSGLDAAIECNPLGAVKICALVAMYNIIVHATVALSYLGTRKRDLQHVGESYLHTTRSWHQPCSQIWHRRSCAPSDPITSRVRRQVPYLQDPCALAMVSRPPKTPQDFV
jgi:hypothetical protein